ncbi:metacaspase-1 isoform X1 [Ziziphus jujuba]|uniref:Metacaspase-1 isoform X1 n=1 Tax=Ziziphus jujuba TaxID=326968 RepID=A0ABM4AHE7_ZIZJJ|nr:metacaspase-1 isoform X1 [Ziziphus jujuba]
MNYDNIKCKTCGASTLVPPTAYQQRCSQCNKINYMTPKIQQPSANNNNDQYQCPFFRAFASKCCKDKKLKSPYPGSLNNIHSSSDTTSRRSNKRALLCGVTYNTRKYKLKGTVNDVINMKELLINQFHYPPESIKVMTEYEKGEFIPTKENIKNSLKWLVDGCKAGDSLVFYFSGHGLRQPDFKDDEKDGFDETICPVDFLKEGMILDNDINTDIVKPLKKGVTLHAIVDSCHSGTILDLVHVYNHHKAMWEDNSPPSGIDKGTGGGLAICISACNDDKLAADTSAFGTGQKTMNGAMTFILCRALKQNPDITYGALLDTMSEAIQQVNAHRCLQSSICRKIFRHKVIQEPMLSSSEKFDVNTKKFIL